MSNAFSRRSLRFSTRRLAARCAVQHARGPESSSPLEYVLRTRDAALLPLERKAAGRTPGPLAPFSSGARSASSCATKSARTARRLPVVTRIARGFVSPPAAPTMSRISSRRKGLIRVAPRAASSPAAWQPAGRSTNSAMKRPARCGLGPARPRSGTPIRRRWAARDRAPVRAPRRFQLACVGPYAPAREHAWASKAAPPLGPCRRRSARVAAPSSTAPMRPAMRRSGLDEAKTISSAPGI